MFYGYNYPKASSGNTGYQIDNAFSIYMIMDEDATVYLVIGIDAPGTPKNAENQKTLSASITSTGLTGLATDPSVVLRDDVGDWNGNWNAATGSASADWRWAPCCTDGGVIGPLPSDGFSMTFR